MPAINRELQLANDFVQYIGCNIFLTGKAGPQPQLTTNQKYGDALVKIVPAYRKKPWDMTTPLAESK